MFESINPNAPFDEKMFEEMFDDFDNDKSGSIDKSEMMSFIKNVSDEMITPKVDWAAMITNKLQ